MFYLSSDAVTDHTFSSLNTLKEEITVHFNNLLQSADEKLTEICKVDKQIWRVLDEEEVECAKRLQMIEKVCDEQIEIIREESEKLKEQIYEYRRELTEQVESYNTELMSKKERLEESCSRVRNWMRESHVTEKLEQRQQMTDVLMNNTDVMVNCPLTRTPVLVHSGKRQVQETHLASIPTSLTLKSKRDVGSQCCSATYIANGDLLVARGMQVRHLDSLGNTGSIAQDGIVNSVLAHQNSVYTLECVEYERIVYQCLPDIHQKAKLFSYSCQNRKISFAAVSDSYIVAHKPDEGKLVLYDFLTKQTRILTPDTKPWDLHFVQDGNLLVLTKSVIPVETLTKYRVDNYQLLTIWTCEDLKNAHRITSDSDGFIYVATTRKTIFIISSDGDKLKEITNDELPKLPGQMSIRGREELVVPTVNEKSAIVFKIDH
ncbi:uncharacterized protein [Watersipora subatra]|uniref:uncharacterized protein n=1 Tax=Watersipora subatra TaxID=2589382 RepID=UPI00355B760B